MIALVSGGGRIAMAGGRSGTGLVRVLVAWAVVSTSRWMVMVAVGVYAYQRAGATGVGALTVVRLLPAMLAAPLAGLLLDRLDRVRVVAAACAGQALAVAGVALAVLADGPVAWVLVATVVVSAVGTPVRPALQSILPAQAATPAGLTRATAVWSVADSVGFLAGAGLGGLAIAVTGSDAVLAVAAGCAAVAALLVVGLPAHRARAAGPDSGGLSGAVTGLLLIKRTPLLHAPFALFTGLLMLEGASDVLLVALAVDDLGEGGPGLLYGVWGAGGLLGGGALLILVQRAGYGTAMLAGALVFGALLAVSGAHGAVVAVAAMAPVGVGYSLVESGLMGLLPRLADDAVLGRLYAVSEVLYAGAAALGALLAPVLVGEVGVPTSLAVVGVGYLVVAAATAGRCLRLDRGEQVASRVRDLLHGVPFLTPLPLPLLERLVRAARSVEVPVGALVVTAGEVGGEFFVVESGGFDVVEYGRRQVAGDGFGEIALLRDVPRTASIRATEDSRLWAVPRSAFLAAVGADPAAGLAADHVAIEHLARPRVDPPA